MTSTITTRDDAATYLCETLGMDRATVLDALTAERQSFGRWEDLEGEALESLSRRVWDRATDGAEWPFGA